MGVSARALTALAMLATTALAACEDRNYNPGVFSATSGSTAAEGESTDAGSDVGASAATAPDAGSPAPDGGASASAGSGVTADAGQAGGGAPSGGSTKSPSAPRTLDIPKPLDGGAGTATGGSTPVSGGAVVVAPGEEPYQKLAHEKKFDEFRRRSASFVELSAEMLPLGMKLADGSATAEERAEYFRMEKRADQLFRPLNAYMWNERWTEADRAAMGWILYGNLQKRP